MAKLISILMSLLMLSSSMNLSLAHHYCGGKLKEVALTFGSDFDCCGMEEKTVTGACGAEALKGNCCQNHIQDLSIEDDYAGPGNIELKSNIIILFPVLFSLFDIESEVKKNYFSYKPPTDLTSISLSLIRVFLI